MEWGTQPKKDYSADSATASFYHPTHVLCVSLFRAKTTQCRELTQGSNRKDIFFGHLGRERENRQQFLRHFSESFIQQILLTANRYDWDYFTHSNDFHWDVSLIKLENCVVFSKCLRILIILMLKLFSMTSEKAKWDVFDEKWHVENNYEIIKTVFLIFPIAKKFFSSLKRFFFD